MSGLISIAAAVRVAMHASPMVVMDFFMSLATARLNARETSALSKKENAGEGFKNSSFRLFVFTEIIPYGSGKATRGRRWRVV